METTTIIALAVFASYMFICGFFGYYAAIEKGRDPNEGMIFGFVLGPLGVIAECCLPTKPK